MELGTREGIAPFWSPIIFNTKLGRIVIRLLEISHLSVVGGVREEGKRIEWDPHGDKLERIKDVEEGFGSEPQGLFPIFVCLNSLCRRLIEISNKRPGL